jgi:hypothetical protein
MPSVGAGFGAMLAGSALDAVDGGCGARTWQKRRRE